MKEFYEDFIKMQSELPSVMKSATGQAGQGKFKYADLTEIVSTIRPILAKHGFAFTQNIESKGDSNGLTTTLIHKSGHILVSSCTIVFAGEDIKKFGAAITYYRRYTLQSMLGIVADDDVDSDKDTISKTAVSHDAQVAAFCSRNVKFAPTTIKQFLTARSGFNKKTIIQNIEELSADIEGFNFEITAWIEKHQVKN